MNLPAINDYSSVRQLADALSWGGSERWNAAVMRAPQIAVNVDDRLLRDYQALAALTIAVYVLAAHDGANPGEVYPARLAHWVHESTGADPDQLERVLRQGLDAAPSDPAAERLWTEVLTVVLNPYEDVPRAVYDMIAEDPGQRTGLAIRALAPDLLRMLQPARSS